MNEQNKQNLIYLHQAKPHTAQNKSNYHSWSYLWPCVVKQIYPTVTYQTSSKDKKHSKKMLPQSILPRFIVTQSTYKKKLCEHFAVPQIQLFFYNFFNSILAVFYG